MKLVLFNKIKEKYINYKLMKQDIAKLDKEGKYFEICEKYPKKAGKYNFKALQEDFENISGEEYSDKKQRKYKLYTPDKPLVVVGKLVLITAALSLSLNLVIEPDKSVIFGTLNYMETVEENNSIQEELNVYDKELASNVSQYDINNMSELEIIMSVMKDIRENTYYDGSVDEVICGNNFRLQLNDANNHGVCRHMADKFTASMNLIDPEYEAFNMLVNLDVTIPINIANITGLEQYDPNREVGSGTGEKYSTGNHLVTVLKSKEYNCYLVVDVTNPSIGVLENGRIHMLNNDSKKFIKYTPYGELFMYPNDAFPAINREMLASYIYKEDYDVICEAYGLEAQNNALEKIKTLN